MRVTPLVNNPAKILITNAIIYFQPFNNISAVPVEKFHLSSIIRIEKRRYVLRHVGIEIFFAEGTPEESLFLTFERFQLFIYASSNF
jgi:factor associated with neutral sphingomyelinase activation